MTTALIETSHTEECYKNKMEAYSRILERIHIGIWEIDPSGNLIYANNSAQKVFGRSFEELSENLFYNYLKDDTSKDLRYKIRYLRKLAGKGEFLEGSLTGYLFNKDNEERKVLISYTTNHNGKLNSIIGTIRDITVEENAIRTLEFVKNQCKVKGTFDG